VIPIISSGFRVFGVLFSCETPPVNNPSFCSPIITSSENPGVAFLNKQPGYVDVTGVTAGETRLIAEHMGALFVGSSRVRVSAAVPEPVIPPGIWRTIVVGGVGATPPLHACSSSFSLLPGPFSMVARMLFANRTGEPVRIEVVNSRGDRLLANAGLPHGANFVQLTPLNRSFIITGLSSGTCYGVWRSY
jgi:hypothetical protein